jgi:hypothetical protein
MFSSFTPGGTDVIISPHGDEDIVSTPLFGFDCEAEYISGFDGAAWGVSPQYILNL